MTKSIVTGGSGLLGSYLKQILPEAIYLSSSDYDLTKESHVKKMYEDFMPQTVIHLAAKVGGIIDNINNPADYFVENTLMNTLLVKYAYIYDVERFIGILSTCIYPDTCEEYPMKESFLHDGPPTETNFSYGYAKRNLAVQIDSYNKQYGTKYNYLIPCNLYGIGDKDDESKSHFVTALIKKIYDANTNGLDHINLFGTGTPLRQFMYAGDLALIIKEVLDNNIYESFNVATEEIYSINEIAKIAINATNSKLNIVYDINKPDGQFRKDVSVEKMKRIFPNFKSTSLKDGIKLTYGVQK